MNASIVVRCLKQVWVWTVFAGVVTAVSILFNILGTITAAVLSGMMIAAIKRPFWHAALASLVFPAVVFLLLAPFREMAAQQKTGLAVLSTGVFWGMYLMTRLLRVLERGNATSTAQQSQPAQAAPNPDAAPSAAHALTLNELQGRWLCEEPGITNGCRKLIEIHGDTFALQIPLGDGRTPVCTRGNVKLEHHDALVSLVFEDPERLDPTPRQPPFCPSI